MSEKTEKVQKIWKVVKTIIEVVIAAICGAGVEVSTGAVSNFISNIV